MYEMFLGPIEQSKPWDTNGIDGVHKFLRKFWRLYFDRDGELALTDEEPTAAEMKTLHKTIKKVREDIENFSFNTSVSAFMICLNELGQCRKRAVLEPLAVLIAPFAPHLAEELWETMGHEGSVFDASYPTFDEKHLEESAFEYPVMVNGKAALQAGVSPLGHGRTDRRLDRQGRGRTEVACGQDSQEGDRRAGQDHQSGNIGSGNTECSVTEENLRT